MRSVILSVVFAETMLSFKTCLNKASRRLRRNRRCGAGGGGPNRSSSDCIVATLAVLLVAVGVDTRELGVAEELGSSSFDTSPVGKGACLTCDIEDVTADCSSVAVVATWNGEFGAMLALGVSPSVDSSSSTRSTTIDAFVVGSDALCDILQVNGAARSVSVHLLVVGILTIGTGCLVPGRTAPVHYDKVDG